ncbi:lateral eye opsin-like [Centruroides sculpturatus]|uniref:lateral eye opsin-like n=1 Tax=Centruroides sculpturatus TaxID=218467 RepID=UPI000C6E5ECF|nr:lateral eye opsin-like [Centruroides sculpturatus]XP_023238426.1 lateral eye opsin-like [Centruroides sculpturatus]
MLSFGNSVSGALGDPYRRNASIVDSVPDNMLYMIDEHWYNFPPINPLWHSLLGIAMVVLGIISIAGNGVVIYLMVSTKTLRTPTNLLIVNLAFSDFCMMAFMMPTMAANCFAETWILGPFMCEVYGMVGSLFGCGSIWTMVMISLDRYNVIVRGMAAGPLTTKKAVLMIMFVWTWTVTWTLLPFFGWNRYVPEGNMTSCTLDYLNRKWHSASYVVIYGCAVYFMPLVSMIYCYFFIVRAVSKHEKTLREQAKKMKVASLRANVDQQKQSAEIRLAKIAMMTVGLWFMAWTPYLSIAWSGIFSNRVHLTPLATIWGSVFAKANACYNPIVYGISHPKYRAALYQKFPSLSCATVTDSSDVKSEISAMTAIDEKPKV